MAPWILLKLLLLTVILTNQLCSTEHVHPRPEVRCRIVDDGFCTPHDKADLCSDNMRITGRPRDEHHLIRIETIVKATGSRPEQAGNVTVDIKCKLRDGVKCFPHRRTDPKKPSDEEEAQLKEGSLVKLDPTFFKVQEEFLVLKKKDYNRYLNEKADAYFKYLIEEIEYHKHLNPKQQEELDLETDPVKQAKLREKFETENTATLKQYAHDDTFSDAGQRVYASEYSWTFIPAINEIARNFSIVMDQHRVRLAERLRHEMCNSGVCDSSSQECAKQICSKNMICEDEPMDKEYMLTVSDTRRKTRRSAVARVNGSNLLKILLMMLTVGLPMMK